MYDGIINIYKEKGFTSHDVVAKLRGILKQKKIGHTGTLDPDATGVLPVCLGRGTKLCDMLTDKEKSYSVRFMLGRSTDTQDISGNILEERDTKALRESLTDERIEEAIKSFEGEYYQLPPMYSAVRVNGRHLYELARAGIEVERKPRTIYIYSIYNIAIDYPYVSMEVDCSKGTYIRTLCHDIGIRLGSLACMTELARTKSAMFTADTALTLAQVEELLKEDLLDGYIMPIEQAFADLPKAKAPIELNRLLYNGNALPISKLETEGTEGNVFRVHDSMGNFIGIYSVKDDMLKAEKIFFAGGRPDEDNKRS